MKIFRLIIAVATVVASITISHSPAQAIPLNEILDSVGKAALRGIFGLPPDRQEPPQSSSEPSDLSNNEPTETTPISSSENPGISDNNSEPSQDDGEINDTPVE
jgi:hypothetical protein